MSQATEERLWVSRDVAKLLNISERTVHSLTQRGELPAVRVGRSVRYRPATIRQYIQQNDVAAAIEPKPRKGE